MAIVNGETSKQILIIGAGVFGLSTALAFLERDIYNESTITIIDSAETLPNPVGSSVDASRIIRADYANLAYSKLASLAQEHWRDQSPSGWGGEGRYSETGFVLLGDEGQAKYVEEAMLNVQDIARAGLPVDITKIQELRNATDIKKATRLPGVSGKTGYANWNSGWADAEAAISYTIKKILNHPNARDRISMRPGHKVTNFTFSSTTGQVTGVDCTNGQSLSADLTILAAGAWTPSLLDLHNRCLATGQVLGYMKISPEEQAYLAPSPVVMNFALGTFLIPPQKQELKIARHGFGYRNPVTVEHLGTKSNSERLAKSAVSVPRTDTQAPVEAEAELRRALRELFPPDADYATLQPGCPSSLADISTRPFLNTRLCWYNDTPAGDFLIDWPPLPSTASNKSLFIATGGSGHGFKFLPVLGKYIVDAVEGCLDPEYQKIWAWPTEESLKQRFKLGDLTDQPALDNAAGGEGLETFMECKDGSRGGPRGMVLDEELRRGTIAVSA